MPTSAKTRARTAAARKGKNKAQGVCSENMNAVEFLNHDHREVEEYFEQYEDLEGDAEKAELSRKDLSGPEGAHAD